jgi:Rps23 Pro-64 3,4-dihydroxylase Tpa1-like proline 4-hydroxylase
LNFENLAGTATREAANYRDALPYPHIVIDDFLSPAGVQQILAEFPEPQSDVSWRQLAPESESGEKWQYNKLGLCAVDQVGGAIRELLFELNSSTFIRFLEKLTGISGLLPDPKLQGGGIHQVLPGGVLAVHADFTRHRLLQLDRRLNVLLYLNENWEDEWEGHLELWSPDMKSCGRRLRPQAGRCVIFNTSDNSFHGHPEPLACPDGITRKSIALYYYTRGRDDSQVEPTHATEWQELPDVVRPPLE